MVSGVEFLTVGDLTPFADIESSKAQQMIDDASALATLAAPCLGDPDRELDDSARAAVKAVLRGAVLRWNEAGSGGRTTRQQQAGEFGLTEGYEVKRRGMFWPSEIEQLQAICSGTGGNRAFSIDQVPATTSSMASRPDLWFQHVFPVPPDAP